MVLSTLFSGLNSIRTIIDSILSKRGTRIEKKIIALGKLQEAINATESYLIKKHHKANPNTELSRLWVEAFTAMIPIDKVLAKMLRNNSRSWSNPESWLKNPGTMELLPTLHELNEACESILQTLYTRSKK